MNYHARLVFFLRDKGHLRRRRRTRSSTQPWRAATRRLRSRDGLGWAGIRRLAQRRRRSSLAMAVVVAFLHASQIGAPPVQAAVPVAPPKPPPGFLQVLVEPWAEVYIDGRLVETTPFAHELEIPEGEHQLRLLNPHYREETRQIVIRRGTHDLLRVALAKAAPAP